MAAAGGVERVLLARCTSRVHELLVSDRATYAPAELDTRARVVPIGLR
jgi:hypothetical protein